MSDHDGEGRLFDRPALTLSLLNTGALPDYIFEEVRYEDVPEHLRQYTHVIDRSDQMPTTATDTPLQRRTLRAYHHRVADFLIKCVNEEGFGYRQTTNTIVLYPPDGSANVTVYARNSDRQLRTLVQWHDKHLGMTASESEVTVSAVDVTPAEIHVHPIDVTAVDEPQVDAQPVEEPDPNDEHWQTYLATNGEPNELIETDGAWYRCRECRLGGEEWITYSAAGIGGHIRMKHRDRSNLTTPEAMAKSLDTRRYNALARHAENAVAELQRALGHSTAAARIAELEAENAELRQKLSEAQARLDLIKEAYGA